ncbi:YdcF family protein [Yokenella regensburgei]|uniref:YdcF family protein n=1 Tax=Yokenella regensburgei TaxID=158877 RepID=UPI003F15CB65
MMNFLALSEKTLNAANTLGQWLAQNAFEGKPEPVHAEAVILAGNAVIPVIDAACDIASRHNIPLIISGGIGHSTTFLYHAVASHPRYNTIQTTGKAEATILAEIARQYWSVPARNILIEDRSSHCGENARFSIDLICSHGLNLASVLVMQDPTMQRRTMATFARASQGVASAPHWLSYPGFTPQLTQSDKGLTFTPFTSGLWPTERYLSLLLGEVPRLRDDAQGYGPNGQDFIVHVDVPDHIEAAWQLMRDDEVLQSVITPRALR